jgi:hypothetical protein
MSGSDRIDSSTQVPISRCAWALVVMSCHVWHEMVLLPEDLAPGALTRYWKTPKCGYQGGGCVPSRG